MLPRNHPDRIQIAFDDHRLVANAGLLLPVTLAHHLGLEWIWVTPWTPVWPRKGHVITAIPASGAITRCWLSPPEPETC